MQSPEATRSAGDLRADAALVLRRVSNELNAELTPGLIHEVNNVLTGIYFNLEALQESTGPEGDAAETLREIGGGVERIKEILARTTQIHLNVAERELSYHDLEALTASELDLLRVVFPKTAKISFIAPREAVNVRVAEFPFRVAMLTVASRIRDLFPTGKIEIPVAILGTEELGEIFADGASALPAESVAVSFRLPCPVESADEIDDYLVAGTGGDLSMGNAERLLAEIGGRLVFHAPPDGGGSLVLLTLPRYDL
jgi:signal transduction histidine kinase